MYSNKPLNTIFVDKVDEAKIRVFSSETIERDLSNNFTFYVPGYIYMPAYKFGGWDGKIRLFQNNELYYGLLSQVLDFASKRGYPVHYDESLFQTVKQPISADQANAFIDGLDLPDWVERRDYQVKAFQDAVNAGRQVLISPTGSGKSFIIYLIYRWFNKKTLLIAPKKNLVKQLKDEVIQYNYTDPIHTIYSGKEKDSDAQLVITTWQSIYKMPPKWFNQFDVVMVDETHRAKSESITNILVKATDVKYRFGFTGTMDGKKSHKWIIEGLLGPVNVVTTTRKLIDDETLPEMDIRCVILSYPESYRKKKWDYREEMDAIFKNELRNDFIVDLVNKAPGVNMVLFHYIPKHGDILAKKFEEVTDRPFYFVHGKSPKELKDNLQEIMNRHNDCIVLASDSMFSEGFNVKHINNIFFTNPSKDRIKVIQSIGRALRKTETKKIARVFDIADNLYEGSRKNYTLQHFLERVKIYKDEEHKFKIFNKRLK